MSKALYLIFEMLCRVCRAPLVLTLGVIWGQAAAAASLCTTHEDTLFDCPSGSKRIAICASRPWSAGTGWVQYRYGTPNKIEIKVPADAALDTPTKTIVVGLKTLAGGGMEYVHFRSGRYRYSVYSAEAEGGRTSGVVVEEDGIDIGGQRRLQGRHAGRRLDGRATLHERA